MARVPTHVHRVAAQGFSRSARAYERARPSYPPSLTRFARRTFRLGPDKVVLDLAAGTGKFTRTLKDSGSRVIAIEPLAAMRREFRRAVPGVKVRPGTAERTGLPSRSVDLVTVAQAFHWFDHPRALREIRRVLRPGGGLLLVWNVREERDGWRKALRRIMLEYDRPDVPRRAWSRWRRAFVPSAGFDRLRSRVFANAQRLTRRGLEERILSISYLATLPPARQAELLGRVRRLLDRRQDSRGRRWLVYPYETEAFWCFRREGPARGRPPARSRRGPRPKPGRWTFATGCSKAT